MMKVVYISLCIALSALTARSVFAQEKIGCGKCHQKEFGAEATSTHAAQGVHCNGCHGGSLHGETKESAHSGDFAGKPQRKDIPQFCAKCHSDVRLMNPYGLPTDQHSQYLTSKHGEALAKGRTDVATCIDCHGNHGIKKCKDPQSSVYPTNVPATCGKCHSNPELMDKHGLKSAANAEQLYRSSVHAELLAKGDISAPTCVTCHGNHGAVPPGFANVVHVCGKCHIKQQELFAESPHASAAADETFKPCIQCHSNHKIARTTDEIFKNCKKCHMEADEPAMKRRDSIFALMKSVREDFDKAKTHLEQLTKNGLHTDDEQLLLNDAKTSILQLPPIQHTLNEAKVKAEVDNARKLISDLQNRLEAKEHAEHLKVYALIPIWVFLLIMSIVFWAKRRSIEKSKANANAGGGAL